MGKATGDIDANDAPIDEETQEPSEEKQSKEKVGFFKKRGMKKDAKKDEDEEKATGDVDANDALIDEEAQEPSEEKQSKEKVGFFKKRGMKKDAKKDEDEE